MSIQSLRAPHVVRRTAPAPRHPLGPTRHDTTNTTVVDVVGYAVLDDMARQQREWCETIAARRAEFARQHPFEITSGRIITGGAM